MSSSRNDNRLAAETSPYLLQHATNPVDWYAWGPEALQRARDEDKPILLSIGYAACHWCHVMEEESFEDPRTAELMNELFVCIKVDREERPDLDEIYMAAVQMMTGHGGWPLTVFLTPELAPFFGGTYFPPEDRGGMPGFRNLLRHVEESYRQRRGEVDAMGGRLREQLRLAQRQLRTPELLGPEVIQHGARQLLERFDPVYGGFSDAPKFPHPTTIQLLLRRAHDWGDDELMTAATSTLKQMAAGGIYDHLAGGFHRYATDRRWLVPHFEKMLYDNALLAMAYLEGYQATEDVEFARVAAETLDWVERDMQDKGGGYYSTLDADSEGVEGKFYIWSAAQVATLLGSDAEEFCRLYDVSATGNWEGHNILNRSRSLLEPGLEIDAEACSRMASCRTTLLEARQRRVSPALDDKVLADWNGLMIGAMVCGYRVLDDRRYLRSAERAANFVLHHMIRDDRLLHTYRSGHSKLLAYLDDYANMVAATLQLYEATFELSWLGHARHLADRMLELFWDSADDGFFFTGSDHEQLLVRTKSGHDGATPSGNAMAATVLQRLTTLTGEAGYARRGADTLRGFHAQIRRVPAGFPQMLLALHYYLRSPREIAVLGSADDPATTQALRQLWLQYAPNDLIVQLDPDDGQRSEIEAAVPLWIGKTAPPPGPIFYVCHDYTCQAPTSSLEEVLRQRGKA